MLLHARAHPTLAPCPCKCHRLTVSVIGPHSALTLPSLPSPCPHPALTSPCQTKRKVEELSHANAQLNQELKEMENKYDHKCK